MWRTLRPTRVEWCSLNSLERRIRKKIYPIVVKTPMMSPHGGSIKWVNYPNPLDLLDSMATVDDRLNKLLGTK